MTKKLLRKVSSAMHDVYDGTDLEPLCKEFDAAVKRLEKPDYWHVIDHDGVSIYSAYSSDECWNHINAALTQEDYLELHEEAALWKVRPLWDLSSKSNETQGNPLT